jgi:hypothetical protein
MSIRVAGHAAHIGVRRGVYRFLVWKPKGKRPLGRPRRRCEDKDKLNHQEVGCGDMLRLGRVEGHL